MVVTQRLLPCVNGETVPAFEIMKVNNAISNVIRDNKTHQIDNIIQTSSSDGMILMDAYIMKIFREGTITAETALANASHPETMHKQLAALG
jgi:twitching motility protein PilT